jgi:hypothetical protein
MRQIDPWLNRIVYLTILYDTLILSCCNYILLSLFENYLMFESLIQFKIYDISES